MPKGIYRIPGPVNEPNLMYGPGSPEREKLKAAIKEMKAGPKDIPMYIGGEEVRTGDKKEIRPPHELGHLLGHFHYGTKEHIEDAIQASLDAKEAWENMGWEHRASIFLKAADLLAGPYRAKINAATMLGQSKNAFQAEIDAACELIDFFRFNVQYMTQIYAEQPDSSKDLWNRMEYRPLEGFVLAISPFNFTAIGGNLPAAPAMMGNTVVWKPANTQVYSAAVIMEVLIEAGLPGGVINMVCAPGPDVGEVCLHHPDLAGLHFTGSYNVFATLWEEIGKNIRSYKTFPRIVGETGGKDFVMVHPSADVEAVSTALSRGAFEYQGQKCSAASRAYLPSNLYDDIISKVREQVQSFKMGPVDDFSNFINAVIDEKAFDKIAGYIDQAKQDGEEIVLGGNYDKSKGYFIEPTVIVTSEPKYLTMCEEIFGPVLTVYIYDENEFEETLGLLDDTSPYALTGAIFSQDRAAIETAAKKLRNAAGNFYINDKPTGAVVNQQPFGGARQSGTNDKAGSVWNLIRWVSPRSIKENFNPPKDYRYPFMEEK